MRKIIIFCIFLFLSCSAEPNKTDLERVVKNFLQLRFQSELDKNLKQYTDYELFQLSCKNNRVKCDKVLKMLEKDNPEFYKKLLESKN
ncbi:MAG: hypothetical protein KatS3mg129_3060 [Leptospiraceae bacterium]|nr:MAG: hypothetical protein KatS3mg129_3060 [Leptospiraceae bacterium]